MDKTLLPSKNEWETRRTLYINKKFKLEDPSDRKTRCILKKWRATAVLINLIKNLLELVQKEAQIKTRLIPYCVENICSLESMPYPHVPCLRSRGRKTRPRCLVCPGAQHATCIPRRRVLAMIPGTACCNIGECSTPLCMPRPANFCPFHRESPCQKQLKPRASPMGRLAPKQKSDKRYMHQPCNPGDRQMQCGGCVSITTLPTPPHCPRPIPRLEPTPSCYDCPRLAPCQHRTREKPKVSRPNLCKRALVLKPSNKDNDTYVECSGQCTTATTMDEPIGKVACYRSPIPQEICVQREVNTDRLLICTTTQTSVVIQPEARCGPSERKFAQSGTSQQSGIHLKSSPSKQTFIQTDPLHSAAQSGPSQTMFTRRASQGQFYQGAQIRSEPESTAKTCACHASFEPVVFPNCCQQHATGVFIRFPECQNSGYGVPIQAVVTSAPCPMSESVRPCAQDSRRQWGQPSMIGQAIPARRPSDSDQAPASEPENFGASGAPADRSPYTQSPEALGNSSHGSQGFLTHFNPQASNGTPDLGVNWADAQGTNQAPNAYGHQGLNEPLSTNKIHGKTGSNGLQNVTDANLQGFNGTYGSEGTSDPTSSYTPQGLSSMPGLPDPSGFQRTNEVASSYYGPQSFSFLPDPRGSNTPTGSPYNPPNDINGEAGQNGPVGPQDLQGPNGLVDPRYTTMAGPNGMYEPQYSRRQSTYPSTPVNPSRPDVARGTYGPQQMGPNGTMGPGNTSNLYAPQSPVSNITYPQPQLTGQRQHLDRQSMSNSCAQQATCLGYCPKTPCTGFAGTTTDQVGPRGVNDPRIVSFGGAYSQDGTDMYDPMGHVAARTINGRGPQQIVSYKTMRDGLQHTGTTHETVGGFQPTRQPIDQAMGSRNDSYSPRQMVDAGQTSAFCDRNEKVGLDSNRPNTMYGQSIEPGGGRFGSQPTRPETTYGAQSKGTDGNEGYAKIGPMGNMGMTESFSQTDTYGSGATSGTFDIQPRPLSQTWKSAPSGITGKNSLRKTRDQYRNVDADDSSDTQGPDRTVPGVYGESRLDGEPDNAGRYKTAREMSTRSRRKSQAYLKSPQEKQKNAVEFENIERDRTDGDEAVVNFDKVGQEGTHTSEIGQNLDEYKTEKSFTESESDESIEPQSPQNALPSTKIKDTTASKCKLRRNTAYPRPADTNCDEDVTIPKTAVKFQKSQKTLANGLRTSDKETKSTEKSQKPTQKTPEQPRRGQNKVSLPNKTASDDAGVSQAMRISSPEAPRMPARSRPSSPARTSSVEKTSQPGKGMQKKNPVKPKESAKKIQSRTPSPPRPTSNQSLTTAQTKAPKRKTTLKRKKQKDDKTKDLSIKLPTSASEEDGVLQIRGRSTVCKGIEQEVLTKPERLPNKDLGTSMSEQSFRDAQSRKKRATDLGGILGSSDSASNYQYLREYSSGEEGDHGTSTESISGRMRREKLEPQKVICTKNSETTDSCDDPKPCWSRPVGSLCRPASRLPPCKYQFRSNEPCIEKSDVCITPPCWSRPPCRTPPQSKASKTQNRHPWQNVNSGRYSRRPQTAIQPPPPCQRNPPWPITIEPCPSRKISPVQCACIPPATTPSQSPQRISSRHSSQIKAECRCSQDKNDSRYFADNLDCKEGKAEGYPCSNPRRGIVEYSGPIGCKNYDCQYGFINSDITSHVIRPDR